MVIGGTESQKHSLSTTTMKRLLLGICWITKDLQIKKEVNYWWHYLYFRAKDFVRVFWTCQQRLYYIIDFVYYTTPPQLVEEEGPGLCLPRFTDYGCPFWDVCDAERHRRIGTERFVLLIRGDRDTSELPKSLSRFSFSDCKTESLLHYEYLAKYLWSGIFKYTWNWSAKIMKVLL